MLRGDEGDGVPGAVAAVHTEDDDDDDDDDSPFSIVTWSKGTSRGVMPAHRREPVLASTHTVVIEVSHSSNCLCNGLTDLRL